jgi:hypothetical protein
MLRIFIAVLLLASTGVASTVVHLVDGKSAWVGGAWQARSQFGLQVDDALPEGFYPAVLLPVERGGEISGETWEVVDGVAYQRGELVTAAAVSAYRQTVIDTLVSNTLAIAAYYGVTNVPIDWFAVDAVIDAASESEDELVATRALRDGVKLNKNTMFLKEWGVDLFNVGAE